MAVVGLNSAWLAGSDIDQGNIIIGERQVREALDTTGSADLILALVHHPLSYLADFDSHDVQQIINLRCDFLLHGHLHNFGVVNAVSPDSEFFTWQLALHTREEMSCFHTILSPPT